IMPLDLAGVGIESQRAVGIEVVAGTVGVVPVRSRVADTPDQGVGRGIIAAGHPGRAAAAGSSVLRVLPSVAAGLALARDGVGAPDLLLGIEIGRRDPAADA